MLTFSQSDNGSLTDAVKKSVSDGAGRLVQTKVGDFMFLFPVIAFFKFLRSLGNAQVKDSREASIAKAVAAGTVKAVAEAEAKKAITRETKNARDVQVLQGIASGKLTLTHKMENRLTSLLKQSVNYSGIVRRDDLDEVCVFLSELVVARAENVTVTAEELGLTPAPIKATPIPANIITGDKGKKTEAQPAR